MGAHPVTRVMLYVQHLLGIGHLARTSRIAAALQGEGADVTVVTGGRAVEGFPGPGTRHVALPAIAAGEGFAGLADADGTPVDDAFLARRRDLLLAAFAALRPDVVVTEAFPFGRRQMRFELLPLLDAVQRARPRPLLAASVRDILQARAKPGRDAETVALVRAHYDRVLVHGDPAFARLGDTFPLADEIEDRVLYSGLVAAPVPAPAAEAFDVVVSAGGGAVGARLLRAAAEAAHGLPDVARWCLIGGPNMPGADFDRLRSGLRAGVELHRFRTDFARLLGAARLSVSQAGYNTVCDVLGAGCACLLVPYAEGGETEQGVRAQRLRDAARASVLAEDALGGPTLADAVRAALDAPGPGRMPALHLDGAWRTARILIDLAAGRAPQTAIT